MPVAIMNTPSWSATTYVEAEWPHPTWSEVEEAVKSLDGKSLQEVYLHPTGEDRETWLCVGGGAGQYILTGSDRGTSFPTYSEAASADAPLVLLTVGGQQGEYPATWVVGLPTALRVAQAFYSAGGFECSVAWVQA